MCSATLFCRMTGNLQRYENMYMGRRGGESNFCMFQMGDTTKLLHNSEKEAAV